MEERCNAFAFKVKDADFNWLFDTLLRFLQFQKQRVEKKEIVAGTLRNHLKTLKFFCDIYDITVPWKKITRGLPRGKRYADDRAPTLEEIRKIIEYPDRRIKSIVYTMCSSGIRLGAWDYLQWGNIKPMLKDNKVVAAKVRVYAGDDDEYYTFITPEAYRAIKAWMDYRKESGEIITADSWVVRNLWNILKPNTRGAGTITQPEKLTSIGIKRLMERALWAQGIRSELKDGKKRHEFQTDHGLRKWFKTRCEIAGMKPINIEILMGHSTGISDSYYRATENELLEDYLKAIDLLTISNEYRLEHKIADVKEKSKIGDNYLKSQLFNKDQEIINLAENDSFKTDAIGCLSDQLMYLMREIEILKKGRENQF
jgi:integrase